MSNKNRGFSLVEIMLVVAGVAGLALVVMQLSKNSAKTQTDSLNFADYIALKSEVDNFFNNDYDCTVTLKDLTFKGSTIKDTPLVVELWHGDQDLNKSRKFLSSTDVTFKKYGKLGINSIEFNMPDYTAAADFPQGTDILYKAQIIIEGDKTSFGKTSNLRPIKKSFNVVFDTDASGVSTIKSCKLNSGGGGGAATCYTIRRFEKNDYRFGFVEDDGSLTTSKDGLNYTDVATLHAGCCNGSSSTEYPNTKLTSGTFKSGTPNDMFGIECRSDNGWVMTGCSHMSSSDIDIAMSSNACWAGDNDGDRDKNSLDIRCCKF